MVETPNSLVQMKWLCSGFAILSDVQFSLIYSIWLFFKKVAKSGLKISYFWWIKLFPACFIASSSYSPLIQPFKFLIEIITSLFLFPSSSKKVVIMLELPLHWTLFLLIRAFLWDKMLIFLLFTGLVTNYIPCKNVVAFLQTPNQNLVSAVIDGVLGSPCIAIAPEKS